jgi:hypothetical protein
METPHKSTVGRFYLEKELYRRTTVTRANIQECVNSHILYVRTEKMLIREWIKFFSEDYWGIFGLNNWRISPHTLHGLITLLEQLY